MDVAAFNLLFQGHAQERNTTQCAKLWADMRKANVKPSEGTCCITLDTLSAAGKGDLAKPAVSDLRNSGVKISDVQLTVFTQSMCTACYLDCGIDALDGTIQSSRSKPNLVTYSTLVKAQADHGNVKDAFRVLERMTDLSKSEAIALIKNLAWKQHPAYFTQLIPRIARVGRCGSLTDEEPFTQGLTQDMVAKLRVEAGADAIGEA